MAESIKMGDKVNGLLLLLIKDGVNGGHLTDQPVFIGELTDLLKRLWIEQDLDGRFRQSHIRIAEFCNVDFGAIREKGINPSCRLVKGKRSESGGGGSGKSSYISNPAKSADLLAQVGNNVMFAEDTACTIDKVEHIMPAGTTFKEAYDFSTNGGWRNRVRMALLKEAGII